jgi:signal transduction histidine kinase
MPSRRHRAPTRRLPQFRYRGQVGARERLVGASLGQRSFARGLTAWVLAVVAPAAIALAWISFRSSFGLAGFLIWALLAVVVVAVVGGVRPAMLAVLAGFVAAEVAYAPPYGSFRVSLHVNLVAFIAFAFVGVVIGLLVDELSRLAREQAALRRVATLAARAVPADELFAAVAEEVGRTFAVDHTNLRRIEPDGTESIVGSWTRSQRSGTFDFPAAMGEGAPYPADGPRGNGLPRGVSEPISVSGRAWGSIVIFSRPRRRLPRDIEARLAHFTDLLAMAAETAQSRSQLAESRARVVAAADETRRRIERDLHDGAQQRLVSLGLDLRTAESMLPPELATSRAQLADATRGLNEVLEGLQEISRGIHPAILSRGGLGPAIKALARRSAVPVELEVESDRRLPESVEVAAYYVVSEALTNVAKHAKANVVSVTVREEDRRIQLRISDDGVGGADPTRGSGLFGLRDRVEVIGGEIDVASPEGAGTTIVVTLPVAHE